MTFHLTYCHKVIFVGLISKYIFHFIIICYTLDVNLNLIKMCPPISTFWLPFIFIQIKSPPDSKQFICLLFTEKICRLSKYSNFCKPFDNFLGKFVHWNAKIETYLQCVVHIWMSTLHHKFVVILVCSLWRRMLNLSLGETTVNNFL